MRHISMKKKRYIKRHKGEMSNRQLWKTLGISERSFYRIVKEYDNVKLHNMWGEQKPKRPGRKPRQIPNDWINKVVEYRLRYQVGAVSLEELLRVKEGIRIPHNTINTILHSAKMVRKVKVRGKRKKYIRWQRKHSLSLWQTDWSTFGKEWLIVIKDDASRVVVGWGKFSNATSENSVIVLENAIREYGKPKAMLTGRDTQFYATNKTGKAQGKTLFQRFLEANNIKHILARVNHPQTCGKIEREFGEIKKRIFVYKDFKEIGEVVKWHNEVKPHRSLNTQKCETPIEAFHRKMHHNRTIIKTFVAVR